MIDNIPVSNVSTWIPKSEVIALCSARLVEVDKLKVDYDKMVSHFYNDKEQMNRGISALFILLSLLLALNSFAQQIVQVPLRYTKSRDNSFMAADTLRYGKIDTILISTIGYGYSYPLRVDILLQSDKADSFDITYSKKESEYNQSRFTQFKVFSKPRVLKFEYWGDNAKIAKILPDLTNDRLYTIKLTVKSKAKELAVYKFYILGFYISSKR